MDFAVNINYAEFLKKYRDKVVIVVIVLFSCVLARNAYHQQMAKYQSLKEKIKSEREKGEILGRIVRSHEKIKKFKTKNWEALDANIVIEQISSVALGLHIKLRDITPQEKKDEKHYVVMPFSMNFDATYKNFGRFVKALETYPKLIRVSSVVLAPAAVPEVPKRPKADMLLRISFTIEAVYIK